MMRFLPSLTVLLSAAFPSTAPSSGASIPLTNPAATQPARDPEHLRKSLPPLPVGISEWIKDPTLIDIHPGGESIQAALKRATPGTIIRIHAGEYHGSLNLSDIHGTPDRPILLISADRPGAAKIIGDKNQAAVGAWNVSNLGIYGLHIHADTDEGDVGGVKLAGAWETPCENIAFVGNLVTGRGQDGVKFFNGARNILVVGNIIAGDWRQECFDNVSVEKAIFAYNTTTPSTARYTSLTMKRSSRDFDIIGNDFQATTACQLSIGGYGDSLGRIRPPYWETKFMAKNIRVSANIIAGPNSVTFAGGRDSQLRDNLIHGQISQKPSGERQERDMPSENNAIENNTKFTLKAGPSNLPPGLFDIRPARTFAAK